MYELRNLKYLASSAGLSVSVTTSKARELNAAQGCHSDVWDSLKRVLANNTNYRSAVAIKNMI